MVLLSSCLWWSRPKWSGSCFLTSRESPSDSSPASHGASSTRNTATSRARRRRRYDLVTEGVAFGLAVALLLLWAVLLWRDSGSESFEFDAVSNPIFLAASVFLFTVWGKRNIDRARREAAEEEEAAT